MTSTFSPEAVFLSTYGTVLATPTNPSWVAWLESGTLLLCEECTERRGGPAYHIKTADERGHTLVREVVDNDFNI